MKIIYTLILFSLISIAAQAQQSFTLNFADTTVTNQVFYTDSLLDPKGIWQIGTSGKTFFDSSFGISTHTDSALTANSSGSFIVTLSSLYGWAGTVLTFTHKYDFDSTNSGGYIEFSIDTGKHWHSIRYDNISPSWNNDSIHHTFCVYDNQQFSPTFIDGQYCFLPTWFHNVKLNTLTNGNLYLTGTDSVWRHDTIVIPAPIPYKTNQFTQFMFRFTAFADNFANPKAGWMIDSIKVEYAALRCTGGGINEINSAHLKVYPDPAADVFQISMTDLHPSDYEVSICDLSGIVVMRQSFQGQQVQMHRQDIDAGSYLIQVRDLHSGDSFQKRIIFE